VTYPAAGPRSLLHSSDLSQSSSGRGSPPAAACSFRGVVTDDDPVAGAEIGYFTDHTWHTLAVADPDGRFHGSCPDAGQADYPLELVVRRAAEYRDCGFPTGTSLEKGRREQQVSINLDATPFRCLK
jgi:hypothetical protein